MVTINAWLRDGLCCRTVSSVHQPSYFKKELLKDCVKE